MRTFKTLLCALALVVAFAGGKAAARGLVLSISGTVKLQGPFSNTKGAVTAQTFSERGVYELITNAVASASNVSEGAISSEALPANGYIAFDSYGTNYTTNGTVYGTFYVTNKSGFYYPLSGTDTNGNYYSFMELDTTIYYESSTNGATNGASEFDFGFCNFGDGLFFSVAGYNISKSNSGSDTSTSKALLYVHDNPYDFGDPNGNDGDYSGFYDQDFYPFDDLNQNAFEIGGVLTTQLGVKDSEINSMHFSLTGSGNFGLTDDDVVFYGVLTSGSAKFQ